MNEKTVHWKVHQEAPCGLIVVDLRNHSSVWDLKLPMYMVCGSHPKRQHDSSHGTTGVYRGRRFELSQQTLGLSGPGELVSFRQTSPRTDARVLLFSPDKFSQYCEESASRLRACQGTTFEVGTQAFKAFGEACDLLLEDDLDAFAIEDAWLAFLNQLSSSRPSPPRHDHHRLETSVQRAVDFIHDCAQERVTADQIAQAAGVSRAQLYRFFERQVGITPAKLQLQVRLGRAFSSLRRGVNLADTATEAGFVDQAHMTRAFRRSLNCTPGEVQGSLKL